MSGGENPGGISQKSSAVPGPALLSPLSLQLLWDEVLGSFHEVQCEFLSAVCHCPPAWARCFQPARLWELFPPIKTQNISLLLFRLHEQHLQQPLHLIFSREILGAGCSSQHAHYLPVRNEESQDQPALSSLAAGLAAGPGEAEEAQRCPGQAGGGNSPWLLWAGAGISSPERCKKRFKSVLPQLLQTVPVAFPEIKYS